ncbi:RNB domain-containing ribonuclease [Demequina sp.]|uniref:RNB domain-containing ribonuclease n=1 Tax=Demequina sp. TaxID=2050685 RepID=UPI0025F5D7AA|nr:RNB domain-containing ribonuclease [Demequina sp.]
MVTRRTVAHAPLTELGAVFAAIRSAHGVEIEHSQAAQDEARQSRDGDDAVDIGEARVDATAVELVTLDPEGSLDLDQAVAIDEHERGFTVRYAIADVAAHVTPNGAVDAEARRRGSTVYCPDLKAPLHPPQMSEGYASLLPDQRTKAVLWTIEVDAAGALGATRVERAWVRSRRRYAYAELTAAPERGGSLVPALGRLGAARRDHVAARGGVTLPRPSQEVEVRDGEVTLEMRAASGIEDDNAQVSLLTGEAAARLMLDAGVGLLRTMPPAEPEAVARLRHQARALEIDWADDVQYAELLRSLDATLPAHAAFLAHATGLFRGAAWVAFDGSDLPVPSVVEHGALAAPYAHVTAPLRRLVDRFATEICLAHSAGRDVPAWVRDALPTVPARMADGARRAAAVDRACIDAVETAMLAPHVGEEFDAVALDSDTVQLASPPVLGRATGTLHAGRRIRVRLTEAGERGVRFEAVSAP